MNKVSRLVLAGALSTLAVAVMAVPAAGAPPVDPARRQIVEDGRDGLLFGNVVGASKAASDTLYVMGGPGRLDGKFQTAGGLPDAQGWVGIDLTQRTIVRWHASTYNAALLDPGASPNHAMWCGDDFAACDAEDPPGGYGNNWDEWLDWYGTVTDPGFATTVRVTARLNHDAETDYDYLYLEVERSTGQDAVASWTGHNRVGGAFVPVDVDVTFSVPDVDYVGGNDDQVHLRWRAVADGGYSDEDCQYTTAGLAQLDNVTVYLNGVSQGTEDFQPGHAPAWEPAQPPSVGNFAKVWPLLNDIDPCHQDRSPAWAFIDDGVVVPGTGGSPGLSWTYGPGGYVVNVTGGLAGPEYHIINEIWSPPLAWPAGCEGCLFEYDIYRHIAVETGLFYDWAIRFSTDGGVNWSEFEGSRYVYYINFLDWARASNNCSDMVPAGCTHVQLALGINETGWIWGYEGTDATPAPYFDNVALVAFQYDGPVITTRAIDLFEDNFPAIGTLDFANPGRNSVRVDMARNIANKLHLRNDPGDSAIVDVVATRAGAAGLAARPKLFLKMKANPLFDAYRTLPPGLSQAGGFIEGFVHGDTTYSKPSWTVVPDRWNFDLPDTGFFFPGDVLHYYVEATDDVPGDNGTARLPADTTGFAAFFGGPEFYHPLQYPSPFVVRALPSLLSAAPGDQPPVLFWNDSDGYGGEDEWAGAFSGLGFEGVDYDIYVTNGPISGVGNGLGGRAAAAQLSGYDILLYTAGNLGSYLLSNGDYNQDPGNDVGVLDAWLRQGGKNLFCTGEDLEDNLRLSGTAAVAFRDTWLAVTHNSGNVRPLIANQSAPLVKYVAGNLVGLAENYIVYGGCEVFNDFDAVTAGGTSVRIAEFTSPAGATGAYPYAAAVYNRVAAYDADVVYLPYDLMYIHSRMGGAKATANLAARIRVLQDALLFFGLSGYAPTGIGDGGAAPAPFLAAANRPNPFNPRTTIAYSVPRAGAVAIRVYDVRGELVRTLVDERAAAAGPHTAVWDGADDAGRAAASGVYFYRVQAGGDEVFGKMLLVR